MASARLARGSSRARFRHPRARARRALRRLRHRRQRRMGERGHRPRHGGFRCQRHPKLVEADGAQRYPSARSLLITADGGGSNGSRVQLWKLELQKLADELGVPITVCHLPPGTSKWNKIEHRLFSFITGNWRGKPLVSHQVIVQLIAATTTKTGLKVRCQLDENTYPAGVKVSDAEMEAVNITRHDFHGEWNYTVSPKALALER